MTPQLGSARASLCTEPIALSSDGVSLKDVISPRAHQPVQGEVCPIQIGVHYV